MGPNCLRRWGTVTVQYPGGGRVDIYSTRPATVGHVKRRHGRKGREIWAVMLHRVVRRCDGSASVANADDGGHAKPRTPEQLLRQTQAIR